MKTTTFRSLSYTILWYANISITKPCSHQIPCTQTITIHTLRYLGALLNQIDEVADALQNTLHEMKQTMEEFGKFPCSTLRAASNLHTY